MKSERPPHVAVLMYPSSAWGRRVLRGVINYARHHGPWKLWAPVGSASHSLRLPAGWSGDGVIARVSTHAVAKHIAAFGAPVVNVSRLSLKGVLFPRVTDDIQESVRLAVMHFLDRGFRHFAYCGYMRRQPTNIHCHEFVSALNELGHFCDVHQLSSGVGANADWQTRQRDLAGWIAKLPKPVAILTWTVPEGQQVIDACESAGLLVPEQVAVLAGDDDDLMCEVCYPPLSAVAVAAEQIGRQAAELMDRIMQRGQSPSKPILVPPLGIITRQSTDTLAINDDNLVAAISFIRQHAADPIDMADVLRAVPVSRSQLERQFRSVLRRSPAAEIRRVHLERAMQLLAETNLPIPEVATASGFTAPEYLARVFRSDIGVSPLKYRNRIQHG